METKDQKFVICLGREYGSGGHNIGKALSKMLGIEYYDKKLLDEAAKNSGISQEYFARSDEKAPGSFSHTLSSGLFAAGGIFMYSNSLSSENIFKYQSEAIREIASRTSCIIVGRCADYVLDGTENLVRLFVYAEIEERINKVREKGYFPEEDILKNIKRIDRERRDYYRYYTGKSWENLENYDLMINTTKLSYDDMVECVVDYLKMRGILAK